MLDLKKMDKHLLSYYMGILIVLLTHVYLLTVPNKKHNLVLHSLLNILAVAMIAYYFMNKEKMVNF